MSQPTKMVDISAKPPQHREAIAVGEIKLRPRTIEMISKGEIEKGDPIQIATLAGVQGAKLAPLLIPLCHPIKIEHCKLDVEIHEDRLKVTARVVADEKTGVEMEALASVNAALLNIWDVVKMYEKDESGQYPYTEITSIRVLSKVKV